MKSRIRLLLALMPATFAFAGAQSVSELQPVSIPAQAQECVILLHGLLRSPKSMQNMESFLTANGYKVVNQGYPSREETVSTLATMAIGQALEKCDSDSKVHFVTHSLGGILVRHYLAHNNLPNLGRVVMLAPPNQGSEVPDKLGDMPGFGTLNGPVGAQLGTDPQSVPQTLGPAGFDVGIIAGTRSVNLFLSTMIPGSDDGKVSVANTKLDGMKDHIMIPVSHPFIMSHDRAIEQTLHYIQNGAFDHTPVPVVQPAQFVRKKWQKRRFN